jgi:hypothetical protein
MHLAYLSPFTLSPKRCTAALCPSLQRSGDAGRRVMVLVNASSKAAPFGLGMWSECCAHGGFVSSDTGYGNFAVLCRMFRSNFRLGRASGRRRMGDGALPKPAGGEQAVTAVPLWGRQYAAEAAWVRPSGPSTGPWSGESPAEGGLFPENDRCPQLTHAVINATN